MKIYNPLKGISHIDGSFGPREVITLPDGRKTDSFHYGIDFPAPAGTPILAAHDGVVTISGFDHGYYGGGNWVQITNGEWSTWYLHMIRTPPVKIGQRIKSGQVIGHVGSTGLSTGPHLHFELQKNGVAVDPAKHFTNSKHTKAGKEVAKTYQRQNREKRSLVKGETLYMTHSSGTNRGVKQNIVGVPGRYIITTHLYVDGLAEGDSVEMILEWSKGGKASAHYLERVQADRHGMIRANTTFQRSVTSGYAVHYKIYASAHNKKTGTLTVMDSDATAFTE